MNDFVLYLLSSSVVCAVIGYLLGNSVPKKVLYAALGFFLSVVGLVIAVVLKLRDKQSAR